MPGAAAAAVVCAGCKLVLVDRALTAVPFTRPDGTEIASYDEHAFIICAYNNVITVESTT